MKHAKKTLKYIFIIYFKNLSLMKNIYNMIYTIDNTKKMEEELFDVEEILDDSFLDMEKLFKTVEMEPDRRLIDNILSKI